MAPGDRHIHHDFFPSLGDACPGAGGAVTELPEVPGDTGSTLRTLPWESAPSEAFKLLCCSGRVCHVRC